MNRKLYFSIFLFFLLGWNLMAQSIDYTVRYNTTTSLYEAYGRPDFSETDFIVGGGSQFSILLPPQATPQPLVVTSVAGGVWTDNTQVNNPDPTASFDFHSVTTSGGMTSFTAGVEALLFTFTVPNEGCIDGIRLFINDTDPNSSVIFMMGADFRQSFTDVFSEEFYQLNYDNDGISCSQDSDGDGVLDADEIADLTDPNNPCELVLASVTVTATSTGDCDGDGVSNADEINGLDDNFATPGDNTDPNDPCDYNLDDVLLPQNGDWATADCDVDGNPNDTDPNVFVPTAADDSGAGMTGVEITLDILTNDNYLDNLDPNNLGVTTITQSGGTATGTVDFDTDSGELTYTPVIAESGMMVTIEYEVCNSTPDPDVCATATITITVGDQDSDGDGVLDSDEIANNTEPTDPCSLVLASVSINATDATDCDGDGVTNADEINGTDGNFATTDDNTDPNDPCDLNPGDITLDQGGNWNTADCDMDGNGNENDPNVNTPVANNDTNDATPGTAVAINVLTNDDFLSNNNPNNLGTTTLTQTGGSATGSVNLDPTTGELTYTPVFAEAGTMVTIEYEVCNTDPDPSICATATVTITVSDQDTDGDGLLDSEEVIAVTDPTDPCSNTYTTATEVCEAIANGATGLAGSDCDNGGISDGDECADGTDPLDPSDDCGDPSEINMACISNINLTLDENCSGELSPAMVLTGNFRCVDEFIFTVDGNQTSTVSGCGRFIYTIDAVLNDEVIYSCWGYVNAEDKTSPESVELPTAPAELFCSELDDVNINTLVSNVSRCYTVDSDGDFIEANFLTSALGRKLIAGGGLPTFTDGCSNIEICVNDILAEGDACDDMVITRIFTARDGDCTNVSGEENAPTIAQYDITFTRPAIADVVGVPEVAEFSCEDFEATAANPQPLVTDYPFLTRANGTNIFLGESFCNIGATFQDGPRITTCENTYKFVRTYTVIDWCEVGTIRTFTQLVKVGDFTAPTLTATTQDLDFDGIADNGPLFFTTNSQDCTAFFVVPAGAATDNCDATPTVSAVVFAFGDLTSTPIGPFNVGELAGGFPVGTHTLVYTASDDCDNTATLPVQFTIGDRTAPVAVCEDGLNISIGGAGVAVLRAADVDRASRDECGAVTLAISRDGVNFFPTLTLDCDDISAVDANGDPIADLEITLQVTDGSGNVNQCWLNVVVEDKAAPICIAPTPRAFNCAELDGEFPDDLDASGLTDEEINDLLDNAFGVANGVDNCPTTTITQSYVDNRTDCGTGTITRTFTVTDAQGLTSPQGACRQTITIIGIHDYTIVFPADAENSECVEPDYNDVTFEERGCDLITVATDIDTFSATADECFKLRITYEVLNWCEYNTESDAYFIPRDADNDNNLNEATYLHVIPRDETTLGDDLAFLDRDNNRTNNTTIGNLDTGDGGILAGSNAAGYGQDGSRGAYVYQQFIKIYDDTAPTLDVDGSVTEFCDLDGDCIDDATLTFTVDDVCSPTAVNATVTLDAFINAGSDDIYTLADFVADGGNVTGSTTNANGTFTTTLADLPLGTHAIRVVATDGCGNTAVDLIVFTINDCKAPTPICINGLTATLMPDGNGGGMAAIWANDFIASPSEDCSGEVKFAIYRSDDAAAQGDDFIANPLDTGLVLTCADRGMLAVRIYAIDPNGNADYCETTLFVQQNQAGICPGPGATVAGLIATPNDEAMSGVEVNITDNNSMSDARITEAGLYNFADLALGEDYTVQPVYDPSVNLANVSTGDLITISRHILGLAEMTNAYQLLAGDVTQDQNINVVDIIAIRRVILGLDNGFSNTNSWRFYTENGAEVFNVNNLAGNVTDANFAAIEMGNVNDLIGARASFGLNIADQAVEAGNVYEVAVSSADMTGFQGTIELAAGLELVDVSFTGPNTAFNLNATANGLIGVSHIGRLTTSPSSEEMEAIAFTLEVRATVSGKLSEFISVSDRMIVSEAYNAEGAAHGLNINFTEGTAVGIAFELGQNSPNPFGDETMIKFVVPTAGKATLTVQDIQGRVVLIRGLDVAAGTNFATLKSKEFKSAKGVFTYTLTAGEFTATRKMVKQ